MDCGSVFDRLSAAMDGELPTDEMAALRQHVASCAYCARQQLLLDDTRRAFLSLAADDVDRAFDEEVLRRVRSRPRRGGRLAAVAALAAALGLVWMRTPAPSPQSDAADAPFVSAHDGPPGWHEGPSSAAHATGIDCGLPEGKLCRPEIPCLDALCAPRDRVAGLLAGASLTFAAAH